MAKRRKKIDKTAVILVIVLGAIATLAVGALFWVATIPSPYDGINLTTFCRTAAPKSLTVVLLDVTDPLTPAQQDRLMNELGKIRETIPRFDRIALFAIDADTAKGVGKPLVDACNPGKAENANNFNENGRILAQKYETIFDVPFQLAIKKAQTSNPQNHSPIIEAIEEATVTTFGALSASDGVVKKLIIVSDMLQNTPELSFYKNVPEFPQFQNTDAFKLHRPSLTDAEVSVWEINRASSTQSVARGKIAEFWSKYFTAQGGKLAPVFWDATKI